ncbi:hypothetical protein [Streptomyces violascens]|uniref:Uncharacterized protein n=1 Tax=Streptomyces violascens TaxID=67381 RepID=A0ABQ3QEW9_9ACTN|nr:hypothetical protein [Streptomyces violascens]GHI35811.1 hypothetical protein Sviol_02190 [Streptomyces violascens]
MTTGKGTPKAQAGVVGEPVTAGGSQGVRPLGAAGGDALTKPAAQGGLGWGTTGATTALTALLLVLIAYQSWHLRRHPLAPLSLPRDQRTGQPQRPNGALVPAAAPASTPD